MASAEPTSAADVETWYRSHRMELVRLAGLALGDRNRAEEVVQDVFARVYRRPPTMREPGSELRYLRSAVLNRCRSRLTRRVTGDRATARAAAQPPSHRPSPEEAGIGRATDAAVLAAVRRLPRRQRDVVLLRYWLDLSEAAIAETLGVSPGTVKTSAHRALQALAPVLEELR